MMRILKVLAVLLITLLIGFSFLPSKLLAQFKKPEQRTTKFEISGGLSFAKLYDNDTAFDTQRPLGFNVDIGYRPNFISPKLMVGVYGFNLPGENTFDPEPTIRGAGAEISYMLLNWNSRFNPFISFGSGWYQMDVPPQPICDPTSCFPDGGIESSNGTTLSISPGAGLYIQLIPSLSLKTDVTVFLPFQSEDLQNSRTPRYIYSGGLSFRF